MLTRNILLFATLFALALAACPFAHTAVKSEDSSSSESSSSSSFSDSGSSSQRETFWKELKKLNFDELKQDIYTFFTTNQDFWPADFGNYGPFMIRQAWHCAGSYRVSDGNGGCDGGRQRFEPERSWDDNTNLDKAKKLLWPIKEKYGDGLSWGDLITLTGTLAIESMGGPNFGFCFGRVDDYDGSDSTILGPNNVQNNTFPCEPNGACKSPFGTTTIGLIYVNPEGPMGNPDPVGSALEVRDTFKRMNMDDYETVALVGGGHAFGKTHGACPAGAGPPPKDDPANPWPGKCGTGKGRDTYTSGFEGPWSTTPTQWNNNYFKELVNNDWEVFIGPGGKHQWRTVNGTQGVRMLTADISLLHDPANIYQGIVHKFATNQTALNDAFGRAWYKLMSRDMGPVTRCFGKWVPPAQPFQYPLPPPPSHKPDFGDVASSIKDLMYSSSSVLAPDHDGSKPYYGAIFTYLAYQCASTFRGTDYVGGCNGARIRFSPESGWSTNVGMDKALKLLETVYNKYQSKGLTWADLIVLAGNVALDEAGGKKLSFCPGRSDAVNGDGSSLLSPLGGYSPSLYQQSVLKRNLNLSTREFVALHAQLRSPSQLVRLGYPGSYTSDTATLSNEYFKVLLSEEWTQKTTSSGKVYFQAAGKSDVYMTLADLSLTYDNTLLAVAQDYATDNSMFLEEFGRAWTKLMNIDRFDGPVNNVCDN